MLVGGCTKREVQPATDTIKLAALLSMSGELGSKGEIRKFAIEQGVEDANEQWKTNGSKLQFELKVADSESDPEVVLEKAKQLWEEGYKIFIAGSSAEIEKLRPWATEKGAIVISYSSTSPTLSMKDDNVFRMVPDDKEQAKALANLLASEDIYGIVPVYRDDIYGQELTKLLTEEFQALYGIVSEPIVYGTEETNWQGVITQVSEAANSLNMEQNEMAVVMISFDEATNIIKQSATDIKDVRWFSSETVTYSPLIVEDRQTAQAAFQKKLTGVTFGIPDFDLAIAIQSEIADFAGADFHPDAMFAYEIPNMLAVIIDQLENPFSAKQLLSNMIEGSGSYAGVTGWTYFNENGDRQYYHYDIWEVQQQSEKDDSYHWNKTGKFLTTPVSTGYISSFLSEDERAAVAQANSYLLGYEGRPFDLQRTLTRAEYIFMLMNATNRISKESSIPELTFADAGAIDERAKEAVAVAYKQGIIEMAADRKLKPNEEITLLEAIKIAVQERQWMLKIADTPSEKLDKEEQSYFIVAREHGFITMSEEEFAQIMNKPMLLVDAMLIMFEIKEGGTVE